MFAEGTPSSRFGLGRYAVGDSYLHEPAARGLASDRAAICAFRVAVEPPASPSFSVPAGTRVGVKSLRGWVYAATLVCLQAFVM